MHINISRLGTNRKRLTRKNNNKSSQTRTRPQRNDAEMRGGNMFTPRYMQEARAGGAPAPAEICPRQPEKCENKLHPQLQPSQKRRTRRNIVREPTPAAGPAHLGKSPTLFCCWPTWPLFSEIIIIVNVHVHVNISIYVPVAYCFLIVPVTRYNCILGLVRLG